MSGAAAGEDEEEGEDDDPCGGGDSDDGAVALLPDPLSTSQAAAEHTNDASDQVAAQAADLSNVVNTTAHSVAVICLLAKIGPGSSFSVGQGLVPQRPMLGGPLLPW